MIAEARHSFTHSHVVAKVDLKKKSTIGCKKTNETKTNTKGWDLCHAEERSSTGSSKLSEKDDKGGREGWSQKESIVREGGRRMLCPPVLLQQHALATGIRIDVEDIKVAL